MSFMTYLIIFALSLTGAFMFFLNRLFRNSLKQYLPAQSLMYIDNDVPKFWYLDRHSLDIYGLISFQTTRDLLRNFANGTLNYYPNDQGNLTFFIIKTDRLLNATASFKDVNLVHSTGIHKIYVIQREPPQAP